MNRQSVGSTMQDMLLMRKSVRALAVPLSALLFATGVYLFAVEVLTRTA